MAPLWHPRVKKAASDLGAPPAQARRLFPVNLGDFALPLFIVIYSAIIGAIEPRFLAWDNIENLMSQIAPLLIMSIGQAFAIITGGLDLSMAAVMSLSGI